VNVSDIAQLQYQNRSLSAPKAAAASSAAGGKASIDKSSELYRQSQQFESIFVKMMLTEMKKSVDKSGLLDGGMAEDIFSDMLYDEYAQSMTKSANFGLADQIYLQLTNYGRYKAE
jgi:Rod binding domain-containing protein